MNDLNKKINLVNNTNDIVQLFERYLIWLLPVFILEFISSSSGLFSQDFHPFYIIKSIVLCIALISIFIRTVVGQNVRFIIYVAIMYILAFSQLLQWGPISSASLYFVAALIFAYAGGEKHRFYLIPASLILFLIVSILILVNSFPVFMIDENQTLLSILSFYASFGLMIYITVILQGTGKSEMLASSENGLDYKNLFENSILGIYRSTPEGEIQYANPSLLKMLGYDSLNELQNRNLEQDGYLESDSRTKFKEQIEQKGRIIGFESAWKKYDNSFIFIRENAICVRSKNKVLYYEGTVEDITERKVTEERLRLFQSALAASSDAVGMSTPKGVHWFQNKTFDELFGDIGSDPPATLYVDPLVGKKVFETIKGGEQWIGEVEMYGKEGSILQILLRAYPFKDKQGNISGLVGLHTDITSWKKAEIALRESEKKYSTVVENSNDAILIHRNGKILYANAATFKYTGYTYHELVGKNMFEFLHPEDINTISVRMNDRIAGVDLKSSIEVSIKLKNGEFLPVDLNATKIEYLGEPSIVVFLRDIQDRKVADEKLRQYKRAIEGVKDLIAAVDKDYKVIFANKMYLERHQLQNEQIIGYHFAEIVGDKVFTNVLKQKIDQCLRGEIVFFEVPFTYPEIGERQLEVWYYPLKNEKNDIEGVIGIVKDITDRKKAEDQIKKNLQEKEVMLKEIHHRVKNNLQIMNSLIYLQSRHNSKMTFNEYAKELSGRIQSMAYIHEQLYKTENMASIYMPTYIESLVGSIMNNYSCNNIMITKDIDDIYLDIDRSVPAGLIFNELMTNIIKHAFPEEKGGLVNISLKIKDDFYVLIFKDNGVGLPDSIDINEPSTLGLKLVSILVKQLDGIFEIENRNGLTVTVKVPASENDTPHD